MKARLSRRCIGASHGRVREKDQTPLEKKNNTALINNLSGRLVKNIIEKPEHRCLVLFNEFAEPAPGRNEKTGRPNEFWFSVTAQTVSAFAGVWKEQKEGKCFAFLTCEPNPWFKEYHSRMPAILDRAEYEPWLAGEQAAKFQKPLPSQLLTLVDPGAEIQK